MPWIFDKAWKHHDMKTLWELLTPCVGIHCSLFCLLLAWTSCWTESQVLDDLGHHTHDVTVINGQNKCAMPWCLTLTSSGFSEMCHTMICLTSSRFSDSLLLLVLQGLPWTSDDLDWIKLPRKPFKAHSKKRKSNFGSRTWEGQSFVTSHGSVSLRHMCSLSKSCENMS